VSKIEQLSFDLKENLEREIRDAFARMDGRFEAQAVRLETQTARLERQGGILQAGTRWSSRMDGWAEKVDAALEAKDREIADLRERVIRLEKKSA